MVGNSSKRPGQVTQKKRRRLPVVDVEPVQILNRRGNPVYRPRPIVDKEPTPKPTPSKPEGSGAQHRHTPSDAAADFFEGSDHDDSANKTKKRKLGGRYTMVREPRKDIRC